MSATTTGKIASQRHDIVLFFDVKNGNPNGDPDAGNMPRLDPATMKGLVTDVCLKRKVRNFVSLFRPEEPGYDIFIREGAVLKEAIDQAYKDVGGDGDKKGKKKDDSLQKPTFERLCRDYFDIRTFGAVLSTEGPLKGSFYGQVRGPLQITFGESSDRVMTLDATITRCAVASEGERKGEDGDGQENRTMGRKHMISYALYRAHAYLSPAFAVKTQFTEKDLDLFFKALGNLFEHDRSAARGEMQMRAVFDFIHEGVGTNDRERADSAKLGCAPAHRLMEKITVDRLFKGDFPASFQDYRILVEGKSMDDCAFPMADFGGFKGVKLFRRV